MISALTSILRFVFRTVLLLIYVVLFLFPTMLLINYYKGAGTEKGRSKADEIAVRLARRLVWLFGISVRVSGTPADGPVLLAANHISWLDIIALHSVRALSFVGKAEIDRWPGFSYAARTGNTIFHQRGNHDSATDVATVMVQRLKLGQRVAIFPEGGILPGHSIRRFHARMFRAAVDAQCPVQPAMVRYLRDGRRDDDISFREGENMLVNMIRILARPGAQADVHFLPLIEAAGTPRRVLADTARAAVVDRYEG